MILRINAINSSVFDDGITTRPAALLARAISAIELVPYTISDRPDCPTSYALVVTAPGGNYSEPLYHHGNRMTHPRGGQSAPPLFAAPFYISAVFTMELLRERLIEERISEVALAASEGLSYPIGTSSLRAQETLEGTVRNAVDHVRATYNPEVAQEALFAWANGEHANLVDLWVTALHER
jgi:hypothetical protein